MEQDTYTRTSNTK